MKKKSAFIDSFNLSNKKKLEPSILWNKEYPLSHIPLILLIRQESSAMVEKKLLRKGCKDLLFFPMINGFYSLVPQAKVREILNMPSIQYITYNHKVFSFMKQPMESAETTYHAHHYSVSGRGVVIAHLDTGIHPHGDLVRPRKRLLAFQDFVNQGSSPYDDHGHGTLCAGCMAGNGLLSNGEVRGVASDALLIGLKCLDEGGTGDVKNTLMALQWVLENRDRYKIKVVHIPFGVCHPYPLKQDPLVMAVEQLWDEGLIVLCAAGNHGPHKASIASPGTSQKVITVGSSVPNALSNPSKAICRFSGRGPTLEGEAKPDLVAPGQNIAAAHPPSFKDAGSYRSFTGTSASSAIVTGAVALLLEKYPNLTPDEVKLTLEMSSASLHLEKNVQGKGILDIEHLLGFDLSKEGD